MFMRVLRRANHVEATGQRISRQNLHVGVNSECLCVCVCACAFVYTHTINQTMFRLLKAFKSNLKVCPMLANSDLCCVDTLPSGR